MLLVFVQAIISIFACVSINIYYAEVAKALKIDDSQISKVAEIFAKEWQK